MYVDSHCHLSFPDYAGRIGEICAEMATEGVEAALCICTTLEEFDAVHALALGHDGFWCSVGVHPDNEGVREPSVADLVERAGRAKVVAIGETGLDYFRLGERSVADMDWQRQRFSTHIAASLETGLPLVVHTRASSADTIAILGADGGGRARGVFHCFTETMATARAALDLGFLVSFSGILTFKNAADLREVAAYVPLESCLIETDSPYLAPVPHRGKTNSPAWVRWVARCLAEVKGLPVETVAAATTTNFRRLFAATGGPVVS